jgi:cyclophilin family peptidyl-prolyl cis-trans isomerase
VKDKVLLEIASNDPFTLFLALQREVHGRRPWELCLLPRPHTPEVGLFAAGIRILQDAGITELPAELVTAADIRSFASSLISGRDPEAARGWELVHRSLSAAEAELRAGIDTYAPSLADAVAFIGETVLRDEWRCADIMTKALGVSGNDRPLTVYLVPFAPFPPGTAFLARRSTPRFAYLDYRRFHGSSMLESLLTLAAWNLLITATGATVKGDGTLTSLLGRALPGQDLARRRLRANVMKLLIAMTAEHIVRNYDPRYRGTITEFGVDLRFPRLIAEIRNPWTHYLEGRTSRRQALDLIAKRLAARPAAWFVEQVDASSLAADFYLLEWLAAQGDHGAVAGLAAWQLRLAADFARHLDFAIGAELAHYDGIPYTAMTTELASFIRDVCQGNSLLRWPAFRRRTGADAYRLAELAFRGPGAEYGGDAWGPIARLMARYADGLVPGRVFIDQCFTLEHNNGSLFDKFYDTWDMQAALRAQADGDLAALSGYASAETRAMLDRRCQGKSPGALPGQRAVGYQPWPPPGRIGCGSSAEPQLPGGKHIADAGKPLFRGKIRKPLPRDVPTLHAVSAVLHTSHGSMTLALNPGPAPLAVGTFVQLARGEVAWRDPMTGGVGDGPFYDGTRFHRVVPGFLLQAGDRTETGRGGPGFRYDEELSGQKFDRPYLVAMVNTGVVTNGSQFFITLAVAPHLDGQYTILGEVADDGSRQVANRLSEAAAAGEQDLRIKYVEVNAA